MDEVNACIAARADQEELVDQPFLERNRVRVSGPFTMEGVIPVEESIDAGDLAESPIGGAFDELETFDEDGGALRSEAQNTEAYLDRMIRLLRGDGVHFPDNKIMKFTALEALADGSTIHAKGACNEGEEERSVAVIFGPQYGPLTTRIVEEGIRIAARHGVAAFRSGRSWPDCRKGDRSSGQRGIARAQTRRVRCEITIGLVKEHGAERLNGGMKNLSIADYVKLSVPERIQLVEDIWDSIVEVPEELPLTAAQRVELDRRLDAYHANPEEGSPWEYVREAIRRS